jgi:two-component system response regulator AtoC
LSNLERGAVESAGADGTLTAEVLFGQTEEMQRIRKLVERIAPVRVPVLIEGESGTGKEAIAVYIHRISPWSERPFLKVNCAAIPGALLESELFGYEKGSFTGAYASRPGKFEIASDGSILLDEIADMDSGIQAKLLQVLQDGRFFRIGDMEERRADARILCITSRKVEAEIERGNFREDLYYRINVVNVRVPPLRERLQDLNAIVDYFIAHYGQLYDRPVSPLPAHMLERFRQHAWPGNIRELENYLKRYVILGTTEGMLSELEQRGRDTAVGGFKLQTPEDFSLKKFSKQAAQQAERFLMLEALKQTRWNRKRAAVLLGISYRALLYKIKEAGLPRKKQPAPSV